jgi:hypothetical protein
MSATHFSSVWSLYLETWPNPLVVPPFIIFRLCSWEQLRPASSTAPLAHGAAAHFFGVIRNGVTGKAIFLDHISGGQILEEKMADWSGRCFAAINQPMATLLRQLYGSGIALVRIAQCIAARSACFAFVLTSAAQVFAFVTCAFVQCLSLIRWKRLAQSEKDGMFLWKYYALFVSFALVSSIAGALSFGLRMHKLSIFYEYSVLLPTLNAAASPKAFQESQRLNAESRLYVTLASHSVNL